MTPREVRSAEDARRLVEDLGLDHVKVGVFDMDGVLRGKYMARDKFLAALEKGFGFCDVIVGWDSYDQLYDNVTVTGWHTGYPDAQVRLLPESCRDIAWEDGMVLFLGEFAGDHEAVCPRGTLRRVLAKADAMGYDVLAGFEYEIFFFEETPHTAREKNYRGMKPIQPGWFGYSVIRNTAESDLYRDLMAGCQRMDFPLEGPGGFLDALGGRLDARGHALVVVAEGAGQRYCPVEGADKKKPKKKAEEKPKEQDPKDGI